MRKAMSLMGLMAGLSLLFSGCGPAATTAAPATNTPLPSPTTAPPTATPTAGPTKVPPTPTLTPYPLDGCAGAGKVCLRWFPNLDIGADPSQIAVEEDVVGDFHFSQDEIALLLEWMPNGVGRKAMTIYIRSGNAPDVIGPVREAGAQHFSDQWLNLSPYIQSQKFDTSVFDPALLKAYQTREGQMALPFGISPGGLFFVPEMFDKAGLAYPPQTYGEKYRLPNGVLVDWNWKTVELIARLLTLDQTGKNATQAGFDRNQIVQMGYVPQWQHPNSFGTYDGGPSQVYTCNQQREAEVAIPDTWKQAWQKHYEAMWGDQPWMPSGPLANSPEFSKGNVFNSGRAAMALTQMWYLCCLNDFIKAGREFQVGIIPMSADGVVHGRVDVETFRIWKDAHDPEEAFTTLAYLITTGGDKLLPTYGMMPAIASKTDDFFSQLLQKYPFVTPESWAVFEAGAAYPDIPSAEGYMPNFSAGYDRIAAFGELMDKTSPPAFDFEAQFQKLEEDLTVIFKGGIC